MKDTGGSGPIFLDEKPSDVEEIAWLQMVDRQLRLSSYCPFEKAIQAVHCTVIFVPKIPSKLNPKENQQKR